MVQVSVDYLVQKSGNKLPISHHTILHKLTYYQIINFLCKKYMQNWSYSWEHYYYSFLTSITNNDINTLTSWVTTDAQEQWSIQTST